MASFLSQWLTWHEWEGLPRAEVCRYYHTVCLHQCTTLITLPVIEMKSQAFIATGPSYVNSNFILPRQRIEAWGINLWSIPNISPTIGGGLAWLLYISMADTNNLPEMYYITHRRMTKLATAQSDENKPNRALQFHGDTAWCNEVTLWLPPSSAKSSTKCEM